MKSLFLSFILLATACDAGRAGTTDGHVAIELLDGEFEVLSGSVEITQEGVILRNATIRVRSGIIVSDGLGQTSEKVLQSAVEPFDT
ncbi:MAG: hypothetical protein R3210_02490, partial [Roseovarius sp.]|nr:hypothetical protein [Roseovarius sp.]